MRALRTLHRPVAVALAPLLLIGCSRVDHALSAVGCGLAMILFSSLLGFVVSLYYCDRIYHFWQTIVSEEHRGDILRLTEASTALAHEAERAISAARTALAQLRRQLDALRREN